MENFLSDLLLNGIVQFPDGGGPWPLNWFPFIGSFVYILISAMYGGGAVAYGIAIVFFTVILKLILLPIDFGNKYFTKKNANHMAKIRPEEDALKQQYAGDPMALNRARQELYRKHGYKMTGFCLFMFVNLILTMAIFFSVFGALRHIADHNIRLQVHSIQAVYTEFRPYFESQLDLTDEYLTHEDFGAVTNTYDVTFRDAINAAYARHTVRFLWVRNIFVPDVPWADSATLTQGLYRTVAYTPYGTENRNAVLDAQFYIINGSLNHTDNRRSWNGLLFLVILAGATAWGSAYINGKIMMAKRAESKPKEAVIKYSMRETKNSADPAAKPPIDPQTMARIMRLVLPTVMVFFALQNTAALAIYIVTNSILSTGIMFGLGKPVDKLLKWQESRKDPKGGAPDDDGNVVINPHTKYFKEKRSKKS